MKEIIEIYNLEGEKIGEQVRGSFYKDVQEEFEKTGKITRQLKTIRLILLNSKGRIYLQKRSIDKSENPGLYDKTVGGHVSLGNSFNLTVVKECAEELGFPASVLTESDFNDAIRYVDLKVVGVFRNVDNLNQFMSIRKSKKGPDFQMPYITAIYVGYYDGAIRFVDGESSGIEVFSIDELESEINENPDKFTDDLKFMVNKYEKYLKPLPLT